jgi:hemolysin activation/secretion protein
MTGIPIFGEHEAFNRAEAQFSMVKGLPDWTGPFSETRVAGRVYGAAGLPNNGEYFPLGGADLFRGFDVQQRQGSMIWLASLEWRIPLVRQVNWDCCDHVVGVRNVYMAPFYDVGNAYVLGHEEGPVAHALGLGLRVDVAWLSLIERTTLRFDVAKTLNATTPWQFWFGFQHPF